MADQRITVWVTGQIKSALDAHHEKCRKAEREFIAKRVDEQRTPSMKKADLDRLRRAARAEALRLRAERWPTQDVVVTRAVERRLQEEDLVGPWAPLTPAELGRMRLAGRWPGPKASGLVAERQFGLPEELVLQLRTASWRVSEPWLKQMEEEGLVGVPLDAQQRARRDVLAASLLTPPQIIRSALGRPFALHWAIPA